MIVRNNICSGGGGGRERERVGIIHFDPGNVIKESEISKFNSKIFLSEIIIGGWSGVKR